jgi:hypothetical protein
MKKIWIKFFFSFYLANCNFLVRGQVEAKLILMVNSELVQEQFISNFRLINGKDTIAVKYSLANIEFELVDTALDEFYSGERIELCFRFFESNSNEAYDIHLNINAQELNSRYMIIRVFTSNKVNKQHFVFDGRKYVYEYESPFGYHTLPRKKGRLKLWLSKY